MSIPIASFESLLSNDLASYLWPFLRISGILMVAPLFGARLVPVRVRVLLSAALAFLLAPLLPSPSLPELSLVNAALIVQEILLGVAMGFTLQMIFDALVIAGQTVAMTMGLGFAMMVDPQRGVSVPVLSQFLVILGLLIFVSLDGHLAVLQLLVESFTILPIGQVANGNAPWLLVSWASQMFAGALQIALPAVVALLVVNIAFGVMSRAAPTLNLFAIGFPAALMLGFVFMYFTISGIDGAFSQLLDSAYSNIVTMLNPNP